MQLPSSIIQWRLYQSVVCTKVISWRFQPVEVGHRHHDVCTRHHVDGAAGIVGSYGDIVRLRQRRDLLQLRDASRPGDVGHDEVGQVVLEDGYELEAGVQPLAGTDRRGHLLLDLLERLPALGRHRLLEPVDVVRGHFVREAHRAGHVVQAVRVDQDLEFRPHRLARRGEDLDRLGLDLEADLAVEVAGIGHVQIVQHGVHLEGLEPGGGRVISALGKKEFWGFAPIGRLENGIMGIVELVSWENHIDEASRS